MTVYLDHAATTPLRPEARDVWLAATESLGNASSIHAAGQAARRLLEESRERLAAVLACDPIEVVFTSGGTESVNLAVKGLWWGRMPGSDAVVLPDGEHHATVDTVGWLVAREGAGVRPVALDPLGAIPPEGFAAALDGAALATALVANNEVGTVSDAEGLALAAARAGVPLHLDAVSAFGHVPVSFSRWRADSPGPAGLVALSVSAHKVGGPAGVGALVVARQASLAPLVHGGGQQRGLRAGTQDVAGAAAFAVAAELATAERDVENDRLAGLRDRMVRGILASVDGAELLGSPERRLPGNAHILFPGASGETLLFLLDQSGIAVSTGSACQAGVAEPSHVVLALGRTDAEARQVLRLTLGRTSTEADVEAALAALPPAVERARAAASGTRPGARS
jgi:cysteine desulfurase